MLTVHVAVAVAAIPLPAWGAGRRIARRLTIEISRISDSGRSPTGSAQWRGERRRRSRRRVCGPAKGPLVVDGRKERSTVVLDVRGLQWASEQNVVVARI